MKAGKLPIICLLYTSIGSLVPKTPALDWDTLQAEKRYQRARAIVEAIAQD